LSLLSLSTPSAYLKDLEWILWICILVSLTFLEKKLQSFIIIISFSV
jgi:hypothetical protein